MILSQILTHTDLADPKVTRDLCPLMAMAL